jgi:sec-independent protein translocase protein TatB
MFEISWSEILILAVVTLVFVGPKELPGFLRMLGKYAGALRKQANEFRKHFDDAMREAELDSMKKEIEAMQAKINSEVMGAKSSIDTAASGSAVSQSVSSAIAGLPTSAAEARAAAESKMLPVPPMPAPPSMEP